MFSLPLRTIVYCLLCLFPARAEDCIFHYGNLRRGELQTATTSGGRALSIAERNINIKVTAFVSMYVQLGLALRYDCDH